MIHVALAFHDHDGNYVLHAAAVLVSLFRRTASPVTALLHDAGLTPVGNARLATVAEYFGQSLRLHAVPEPPPEIAAGLPPQFGPGSLYRLHLPRLLDEEQVIYLDCDVCCTLDIRELWEEATQEQSRCCPACAIRRPKARAGNSEKKAWTLRTTSTAAYWSFIRAACAPCFRISWPLSCAFCPNCPAPCSIRIRTL